MADTVWLLDTSILIDVLRGSTIARRWIDAQACLSLCHLRDHCGRTTSELHSYSMRWLDEGASQSAFGLYQRFHLSHSVGFFDCLIAATAQTHALKIATLNLRHFAILPGVRAERPY